MHFGCVEVCVPLVNIPIISTDWPVLALQGSLKNTKLCDFLGLKIGPPDDLVWKMLYTMVYPQKFPVLEGTCGTWMGFPMVSQDFQAVFSVPPPGPSAAWWRIAAASRWCPPAPGSAARSHAPATCRSRRTPRQGSLEDPWRIVSYPLVI